MARVSYVEKGQAAPPAQELFQQLESRGARVLNLHKVLAHSPEALRSFIRLGYCLLARASLEPRLRELAILRVAYLTYCRYEWSQHLPLAQEAGVSQPQIDSLGYWPRSAAFNEVERAVLAYTDEVTERVRVAEETFARLRQHLDEAAIVELTLVVGYWGMVARLLVALAVDPEEPLGSLRHLIGD